jgi:hypothetical protein
MLSPKAGPRKLKSMSDFKVGDAVELLAWPQKPKPIGFITKVGISAVVVQWFSAACPAPHGGGSAEWKKDVRLYAPAE